MNPTDHETEDTLLPITEAKAREIIAQIIPLEDDGRALALVALVQALAYEDDRLKRDEMAGWLTHAAYSESGDCSEAIDGFIEQAKVKYLAA